LAIIDTGINPNLAEFAGRIDPASRDVAGNRGLGDEGGHGTAVAATAAGARNDAQNMGVAFDATIIAMRADEPGTCADTSENGGCSFYDSAIADGVDAARTAGAKVINMSLGGEAPGQHLLSAIGRAVNAGIVMVISAGNDGEKAIGINADPFALTAAQTYPGKVIIAGALDPALNNLAYFSNRAGAGQNWYLTALGQSVRTIDQTGTGYFYSGTSFSAPIITGAVALMAQAFPNLTGQQIVELLFSTADDLGEAGDDSTFGQGRLNITRAFQPVGQTSLAGSATQVGTSTAMGTLPEASGDAGQAASGLGAVILDSYSRAFAIDLAARLEQATARRPLERALSGHARTSGASAGPIAVTLSMAQRQPGQLARPERLGIGPEDAAKAKLVAGQAIARIDAKTRIALGILESAKGLERTLSGAASGAFLIARDATGEPGFAARRGQAIAVRRELPAGLGLTLGAERGKVDRAGNTTGVDLNYRLASISMDRSIGGSAWLSLGVSRLEEQRSLLGGRMGNALGGGGSSTWFVDAEARRSFGLGLTATLSARRGWTDFAGGRFQTEAYAFDLARTGVLGDSDRIGLRLSQPLRVEQGGFALMLPTGYDYATGTASSSLSRMSMRPSGREIDAELGYSTGLGRGWLSGNLYARREPGHIAGADADVGAAIRYSLGF
jgi:hypothetical protein